MQPAGWYILVKPDPAVDAIKADMIAIPDAVLDRQRLETNTGKLVAVGAQAWQGLANSEPWAKVGDHVMYAKHGGKLYKDPKTNEELVLLNDRDIIGILD